MFVNNIKVCLLLMVFIFFSKISFAIEKSSMIDVIYIKDPIERIIFEFNRVPEYQISGENNTLSLQLYNTNIKSHNWVKKVPIIKEVDLVYEQDKILIKAILNKSFNFKASSYENKLIVDIIWKDNKKPNHIIIKENNIQTFNKSSLQLPNYYIPKEMETNLQLPLTKKYNGTPISVDFQNADLHSVFRFFAELSNSNIIVSDKIKGTVTLKLKEVPWDLVLDIILANHNLAMVLIDNVIRIIPMDEIKLEMGKYKDYIALLSELQEKGPQITKFYQLKYVKVDSLVETIKGTLSKDAKFSINQHANMLIIKDTQKNLLEIERIINEIDRPNKQILIEARIVEMQNSYVHRLGIKWGGTGLKGTEHTIIGAGRSPLSAVGAPTYTYPGGMGPGNSSVTIGVPTGALVDLGTAGTSNLGFIFGHIGKSVLLLDVQLSALENQGVARIFARPKVLTLDNQDAEIKQGYKIPYLQLNQQGVATTNFIDAVLRLKVTPQVTPDYRLNLDIEIEKSTPDWGRMVNNVPALMTRYAKTKVLINSGDTLVIGGIKTEDLGETLDQVPGLSQVPGLGEAFKKREKVSEKTELMVFITPRIVSVEIPGVDF